VKGY